MMPALRIIRKKSTYSKHQWCFSKSEPILILQMKNNRSTWLVEGVTTHFYNAEMRYTYSNLNYVNRSDPITHVSRSSMYIIHVIFPGDAMCILCSKHITCYFPFQDCA